MTRLQIIKAYEKLVRRLVWEHKNYGKGQAETFTQLRKLRLKDE